MRALLHALAMSIALVLTVAATSSAQDQIQLRNGDVIQGKVREVSDKSLRYQKAVDGPLYEIQLRDVLVVRYENGVSETYPLNRGAKKFGAFSPGPRAHEYGNNILDLLPIAMTDRSIAGFGLRYERVVDKDGYFSFSLPASLSLISRRNWQYSTTPATTKNSLYTHLYPGVKFYPASSKHGFSYALGLNLMVGFGNLLEDVYTLDSQGYTTTNYSMVSNYRFGIMLGNSLNFSPTPRLHIGIEFLLGFKYIDHYSESLRYGADLFDSPVVNFNIGFGYRF